MIIAISGVPGTGKTEIAKILAKDLKANLIDIKKLLDKKAVKYTNDEKRKTRVVDVRDLQEAVNKKLKDNKLNIIEGHLSHLLDVDMIIILRTNPKVLRKRLKKRKWPETKIRENLEAEMIDEITVEALEKQKRTILEIDTSSKSVESAAKVIEKVLNSLPLQRKYEAGQIDWTERYKNELTK